MIGDALDFYLRHGYFRMQQQVFTCRYVPFAGRVHSTHWIRFVLPQVTLGRSQREILKRNKAFSVEVKPFVLTDEVEELYARYRADITFEGADSVAQWLYDDTPDDLFDTWMVAVRDGARFISAGIFDRGQASIMGVMNFFDPDYRRHSPGKFLMLQKLLWAQGAGMTYYYPGYVVRDYPKFDYKLFPCLPATEVFDDVTTDWLPFSWDVVNALANRPNPFD